MLEQVLLADRQGWSPARDNAVSVAMLFGCQASTQIILGVMADYSAAVSAIRTITFKKGSGILKTGPVGTTTLSIGSNTGVASTAFQYAISETMYQKAAVTSTALAAGTIPADTWGIYLLSINAAGTVAVTAGAANFTTGYASEALAVAALPDTPSASASMGYVTVLTASGQPFVGGTDALQGGTGGNPSADTNYTSTATIAPATEIIPPLRWDFSNGPCYLPLPGSLKSDLGGSVSAELDASGTGGTTGRVILMGFSK